MVSGPFTLFCVGFVPFLPAHESRQHHLLLAEHSPRSCTRSYIFELAAMGPLDDSVAYRVDWIQALFPARHAILI